MAKKMNGRTYENVYPARKMRNDENSVVQGLVLLCTPLRFYTQQDENFLFECLITLVV